MNLENWTSPEVILAIYSLIILHLVLGIKIRKFFLMKRKHKNIDKLVKLAEKIEQNIDVEKCKLKALKIQKKNKKIEKSLKIYYN